MADKGLKSNVRGNAGDIVVRWSAGTVAEDGGAVGVLALQTHRPTYAGNEILSAYCRGLVILSTVILCSVHAAMTTETVANL